MWIATASDVAEIEAEKQYSDVGGREETGTGRLIGGDGSISGVRSDPLIWVDAPIPDVRSDPLIWLDASIPTVGSDPLI